MNSVVEEALTNMIKRIEKIERILETFKKTPEAIRKPTKPGEKLASPGQIDYVKSLGGQVWEGMTSMEAGEQIDTLKAQKQKYNNSLQEHDKGTEDVDNKLESSPVKNYTEEEKKEFPDY